VLLEKVCLFAVFPSKSIVRSMEGSRLFWWLVFLSMRERERERDSVCERWGGIEGEGERES